MKLNIPITIIFILLFVPTLTHAINNLNFYVDEKGFTEDMPGYDFMSLREGIVSYDWTTKNTLHIISYVTTFCAGADITGGEYEINNDTIILRYSITKDNAVSSCVSPKKVVYDISNLEKKEYVIRIEQICENDYLWDLEEHTCLPNTIDSCEKYCSKLGPKNFFVCNKKTLRCESADEYTDNDTDRTDLENKNSSLSETKPGSIQSKTDSHNTCTDDLCSLPKYSFFRRFINWFKSLF